MLLSQIFKVAIITIISYCSIKTAAAQDTTHYGKVSAMYTRALADLQGMVTKEDSASFKKAVFITENVYLENTLDYSAFEIKISQLSTIVKAWTRANPISNYRFSDSANLLMNYGIYKLMKDSIKIASSNGAQMYSTIPYTYDFSDYTGSRDWTKMFVLNCCIPTPVIAIPYHICTRYWQTKSALPVG